MQRKNTLEGENLLAEKSPYRTAEKQPDQPEPQKQQELGEKNAEKPVQNIGL